MSILTATARKNRRRSQSLREQPLSEGDMPQRRIAKPRLCNRCRRVLSGAMRLAHHRAAEHSPKTLNDIYTMRNIHTMRDLRRSS